MLTKRNRLKSPAAFKRALRGKRLCSNNFFVIYTLPFPSYAPPQPPARATRFGLIVSRKIDKRAVRRNRIKRRLREIIRTRLLTPENQGVLDCGVVVIVVRSGILEASYQQIQEKLVQCFQG
jgi:ribonuclease P protein component